MLPPQCGEREDDAKLHSELRRIWLRHALQPPQTHDPIINGRPIAAGKRKWSQMRYGTRVRHGLTKSIAGEVVRDARMTLLAASWRGYERQRAAHALLMGRFIQHQIREASSFVDYHDLMAERQVQAETSVLTNSKLHDTFHLINNLDHDFSDDEDDCSKGEVYDVLNDNPNRINNGLHSGTAKESLARNKLSTKANKNQLRGKLALLNSAFASTKKGDGRNDQDYKTGINWERRIFSAVRELDVAQHVNNDILKSVTTRVARLAVLMAAEKPREPICAGFSEGPSEGARRVAVYRSFAVRWVLRMLNEEYDKDEINTIDDDEDSCYEKEAEWVCVRFADNTRLAEMSVRDGALQSVNAEWTKRLLLRARESQIRALFKAMHSPRASVAQNLISIFGSARRVVRARFDNSAAFFAAVHGPFNSFQRVTVNRPLIIRFLQDTFQSLSAARVSHFASFVSPCDNDRLDILRTTPDERLEAFLSIARNVLVNTPNNHEACVQFDASWRLFCRVCSDTRVQDCTRVTANLLDAEKRGAFVLRRLASDSVAQTCQRCPDLDRDGALVLKRFAQAFIESPASLFETDA